jgi:hypothetical protein
MAKKKTDPFKDLMSNIDWTRWLQLSIPILQPIAVFGGWLAFANLDKKADAVSKIIAIGEVIPAVDLNVPKPVVLASLYHSTAEALDVWIRIMDVLEDIPDAVRDLIKGIKEEVIEPIVEPVVGLAEAIEECRAQAKKDLGYGYYIPGAAQSYVTSCLIQKGFDVEAKDVLPFIGAFGQ